MAPAIFLIWILPIIGSVYVCKTRNRNWVKGMFVTFFLSWPALIMLWLGLKRRNPSTLALY